MIERNQNEEYLIPSLLALKHKVERLFGTQPSVSLSESRVCKTENMCENEVGKRQFRLYAESMLENRKKNEMNSMNEKELDVDLGSEIEEVNETLLSEDHLISGCELSGIGLKDSLNGSECENRKKEREKLNLSNENENELKVSHSISEMEKPSQCDKNPKENEKKYKNENENHPNNSNEMKPENHSYEGSKSNKYSYDYQSLIFPKREKWKPLFSDGEILYRRFHYTLKAPSRDSVVLQELMKSYHLPCCHYDDLTTMKEFNTSEVLNELLESESESEMAELPSKRLKQQQSGNRIEFWKDILGSSPIPHFRRYVYAIKPPTISLPSSSPPPLENTELQSSLNTSTLLNSSVTQLSQNETPPVMN